MRKNLIKSYIEVGKIIKIHGINGFLKIDGWCDDLGMFKDLDRIYLDLNGRGKLDIEEVKFSKSFVLIKFKDINAIEEAQRYIGRIIYVKREDLKIDKDEILIQDLIGVEIYDCLEKNLCYGEIKEVIKTGANDVYVISNGNGEERLIPVINDVIKEKDLENGRIYINVIEGLFDV